MLICKAAGDTAPDVGRRCWIHVPSNERIVYRGFQHQVAEQIALFMDQEREPRAGSGVHGSPTTGRPYSTRSASCIETPTRSDASGTSGKHARPVALQLPLDSARRSVGSRPGERHLFKVTGVVLEVAPRTGEGKCPGRCSTPIRRG